MRFRLRTLLIAMAIVPPVASLFWWLVARTELLPVLPAIPVGFTFAALAAIFVAWLSELADYVGPLIIGKRKIEFPRAV